MAVTLEGTRLTEAHRLAQLGISRAALRDILAVWRLLDPSNVDSTFPGYARAAEIILAEYKRRSANAAAAYIRAFREAEGVSGQVDVALLERLSRQQAMTSLLVTGPVTIKTATREGHPEERASNLALTATLGAVTRLVLQGARDTIVETVKRDREALGFARVTDGNPCYFCAMLASRGAVYKSRSTADFQPHDRCGCQPEPVYSDSNYKIPGRAAEFAALWEESTQGYSGKDAINAFRRAYNAER